MEFLAADLKFTIFYLSQRSSVINLGDETDPLKLRPSETIEQDIRRKWTFIWSSWMAISLICDEIRRIIVIFQMADCQYPAHTSTYRISDEFFTIYLSMEKMQCNVTKKNGKE